MAILKKSFLFILVILSVIVLALQLTNKFADSLFQINQKSGVRVLSIPTDASVYLDDNLVGKTPYEDQSLQAKEYRLKVIDNIATQSAVAWQGKIKLTNGTLAVVNRDLAKDIPSSAGETLTLEKGSGVTVISSPSQAVVEVDGKDYGLTPTQIDIKSGDHTFVLKHSNYLNRSIRAQVPDNFKLILNVDLALSEADLTSITTPPITQTPAVLVKETPTGFLRVREKADTSSREIGRVSPGDELILLEELALWDRVRLVNGVEGYVSKTYVEKKGK